jgi:hypothetical protein
MKAALPAAFSFSNVSHDGTVFYLFLLENEVKIVTGVKAPMQTVWGIFFKLVHKLSLGLKNILNSSRKYLAFSKLYRLILHLEVSKHKKTTE